MQSATTTKIDASSERFISPAIGKGIIFDFGLFGMAELAHDCVIDFVVIKPNEANCRWCCEFIVLIVLVRHDERKKS